MDERDLALAWQSYKVKENPVGVTLQTDQAVYSISCLRHFLCAGIGLTKVDKLPRPVARKRIFSDRQPAHEGADLFYQPT